MPRKPHKPLAFAIAFSATLAMTCFGASAEMPNADVYYRMSTSFRGTDQALDVFNGGDKNNLTRLATEKNVTGQFWNFVPVGDGTYRLTSQFRGPGMCLDIFNGGATNNQPHLAACGDFSGQFWRIVEDGDWVRLKTVFRGNSMCLDIFNGGPNDGQPHLAPCGNFSGQLWLLTATSQAVNQYSSPPIVDVSPKPKSAAISFPFEAKSWGGAVRSGPGAERPQIASLNEREPITVLEQADAPYYQDLPWFKIAFRGRVGYQWGGIICPVDGEVPGTFQVCK